MAAAAGTPNGTTSRSGLPHCITLRATTTSAGSSQAEHTSSNDDDDDISYLLCIPPQQPLPSAGDQPSQQHTDRFLHTVLHTQDEQMWKDMVCAALQHGKLQSKHLLLLLQRSSSTTSPLLLRRVVAVVRLIGSDGALSSSGGSADASLPSSVRLAQRREELLSPRFITRLLSRLLKEAEQRLCHLLSLGESGEGFTATVENAVSLTSYGDIWELLGWMERRHLHIPTLLLLEQLEASIDKDGMEASLWRSHLTAKQKPGTQHTASPPSQAAFAKLNESHINRFEYISRERRYLLLSQVDGGPESTAAKFTSRHRVSYPKPEPATEL